MAVKNLKILIVDDLELMRRMLKVVLEVSGYTNLEEAVDGREAMEKLTKAHMGGKPFDIIFCDWTMPGLPGIEVLRLCRLSPEFSKLPFVMVTAESEKKEVMKAISAGATDYIVKPIKVEALIKKMERIIAKLPAAG